MWKYLQISLLLSGLLFSCSLADLSSFNTQVFPAARDQILAETDAVWIEFSEPVEKEGAEMLFRVLSPSGSHEGDFFWVGTRLVFTPQPGWDRGVRYVLSFQGEVETEGGRRFQVAESVPFFAVTNDLPPLLTGVTPVPGGILGSGDAVTFTFSKEMDVTSSIDDWLNLSPDADITHEWQSAGTVLVVRPRTLWQALALYSWTLKPLLKDSLGIALSREYTGTFLVQNPAAPPPEVASLKPAIVDWEFGFPDTSYPELTRAASTQDAWIGFKDAIRINFLYRIPPSLHSRVTLPALISSP
ncbi:MAG TPA: hypothetical protein ENN69_01140 [Spirochaetia bacterium]|nr:hypothetical protein [Spirochaetia bacterium]